MKSLSRKTVLIGIIAFIHFLFFTSTTTIAQTPTISWATNTEHGFTSGSSSKVIAIDNSGNRYTAGTFLGQLDADGSAGTFMLTAQSTVNDVFIIKENPAGNFVWAKQLQPSPTGFIDINAIATDGSNNILLAGNFTISADMDPNAGVSTITSNGLMDAYILKLTSNGDFVWAKSLGGGSADMAKSVDVDASDNVYLAGNYITTVDFDPSAGTFTQTSAGSNDMYMVQFSATGVFGWAKSLGGSGQDNVYAIQVDNANNLVLTGSFNGTADMDPSGTVFNIVSNGSSDIFVAKYTNTGAFSWAKSIGSASNPSEEAGSNIAIDNLSNIYISGFFYGSPDFNPGAGTNLLAGNTNLSGFLLKLDATGVYQWASNISYIGSDINCLSLSLDNTLNTITACGSFKGNPDFDPGVGVTQLNLNQLNNSGYALQLSTSGAFKWAKGIGVEANIYFQSIATDASGNCFIAAQCTGVVDANPGASVVTVSSSSLYSGMNLALDANGLFISAKMLDNTFMQSIAVGTDNTGNSYVASNFSGTIDMDPGASVSKLSSNGQTDIVIQKFDPSGVLLWAKSVGDVDQDEVFSIAVNGAGDFVITGRFKAVVDMDPSASSTFITSNGAFDTFIAKYTSSGSLVWAKSIGNANGTTTGERGYSIALDGSNNVYVTGLYEGTIDSDPGAGTSNLVSAGLKDIFILKLNPSGNLIWSKTMGGTNNDEGRAITTDINDNVIVTGFFSGTADFNPSGVTINKTSSGSSDAFIEKFTSAGDPQWVAIYGGTGNTETSVSIKTDGAGNIFTIGDYTNTIDIDPSAGSTLLAAQGNSDIFIQKLSPSGSFIWGKSVGGSGTDNAKAISIDLEGAPCMTGNFSGNADFDPDAGVFSLASTGNTDIFAFKLLPTDGSFVWAYTLGNTLADNAGGIAVDKSNKLIFVGLFGTSIDTDPTAGGINTLICTSTKYGAYVIQWDQGSLKSTQTITAVDLTLVYGDTIATTASTNSNLPLTIISSNPAIVSIIGNKFAVLEVGTVTITYQQPGNAAFFPATDKSIQLTTIKKDLVLSTANVTRTICEPNPSPFLISYAGFVGTENETQFNPPPTYSTTAANVPGTFPITGLPVSNVHYNIIMNDAAITVTDIIKPGIIGKDIITSSTRATYTISPQYLGNLYAWYYSEYNITVLGDTIYPRFDVLAEDTTTNGKIMCVITGCAGVDTLTKTISINRKKNYTNQLEDLVCTINRSVCANNFISYVSIENIFESMNDSCSENGYCDYTASSEVGTLYMGDTYTATVRGGGNKGYFGLWIDYNNDGDFQDAQEYIMANDIQDYELVSQNVAIPNSPEVKGPRRLRIQTRDNAPFQAWESCIANISNGEIEDYTILIDARVSLQGPQFVSPNNDGTNDLLVIRGINPTLDNSMMIMNLQGEIIYEKNRYENTWPESTVKAGTYYYVFKNGDNELKSYVEITY